MIKILFIVLLLMDAGGTVGYTQEEGVSSFTGPSPTTSLGQDNHQEYNVQANEAARLSSERIKSLEHELIELMQLEKYLTESLQTSLPVQENAQGTDEIGDEKPRFDSEGYGDKREKGVPAVSPLIANLEQKHHLESPLASKNVFQDANTEDGAQTIENSVESSTQSTECNETEEWHSIHHENEERSQSFKMQDPPYRPVHTDPERENTGPIVIGTLVPPSAPPPASDNDARASSSPKEHAIGIDDKRAPRHVRGADRPPHGAAGAGGPAPAGAAADGRAERRARFTARCRRAL